MVADYVLVRERLHYASDPRNCEDAGIREMRLAVFGGSKRNYDEMLRELAEIY